MSKYIDADKITPIMAEYVADVFSRKEHLDNISYGYCMEIADVFRQYAERAKQERPEVDLDAIVNEAFDKYSSVDGYGQLSVSFNRAELYSFIKEIARKEDE